MKTSNKLLIGFATALILIPILGMVYVSATQYRKGTYNDSLDVVQKVEKFSSATEGMTSRAISSPFESVSLPDGLGMDFNIQLIQDEQFGIKISNNYQNRIAASIDKDGLLQLSVANAKSDEKRGRNDHAIIYIYAPKVSSIAVANVQGLSVKSIADTLSLNMSKVTAFYFDNGTQLKQLNLKANLVKELTLRKDDIKSINAVINDTKFAIETMSLDYVNLTTNGNSKIEVYKYEDDKKDQIIKNLVLNTNGIAEVTIENVKVDQCSGKFSDQTTVKMPAVNINQMFKKN